MKSIETLPAVALSEVLLYFNWPSALASRLRALLAVPLELAGVVAELVVAEDEVAGVVAEEVVGVAAVVEELVVLEELPHPASASRPTATVTAESVGTERIFARPCAGKLTSHVLHR